MENKKKLEMFSISAALLIAGCVFLIFGFLNNNGEKSEKLPAFNPFDISEKEEGTSFNGSVKADFMELETNGNRTQYILFICKNFDTECNGYYPVIDFQKDTTIVSFKTMNPSSYSETARISKIDEYAEALESFVQYHGDDLCNNKILDIRVPPGTSNMIDEPSIEKMQEKYKILIKIGEFE